jgi:hypothetical protein
MTARARRMHRSHFNIAQGTKDVWFEEVWVSVESGRVMCRKSDAAIEIDVAGRNTLTGAPQFLD